MKKYLVRPCMLSALLITCFISPSSLNEKLLQAVYKRDTATFVELFKTVDKPSFKLCSELCCSYGRLFEKKVPFEMIKAVLKKNGFGKHQRAELFSDTVFLHDKLGYKNSDDITYIIENDYYGMPGRTIRKALYSNDETILKQLLSRNIIVDALKKKSTKISEMINSLISDTPLKAATCECSSKTRAARLTMAHLLLQEGLILPQEKLERLLKLAIGHGQPALVEYLFQQDNLKPKLSQETYKNDLLRLAITYGNLPVVTLLFKQWLTTIDLNDMFCLATKESHYAIADFILTQIPAKPAYRIRLGDGIYMAIDKGNPDIALRLLNAAGVDSDTTPTLLSDKQGEKPYIHLAELIKNKLPVLFDYPGIVGIFLRKAAEKNSVALATILSTTKGFLIDYATKGKETALHKSAWGDNDVIAQWLLENGTNKNAQCQGGKSPLHIAAQHRENPKVLKLLLKHKANPMLKDNEGCSPLHTAGCIETIKLLIQAGLDPDTQDNMGNTPLHTFIRSKFAMACFLLDQGANPMIKNKDGKTAFSVAWVSIGNLMCLADHGMFNKLLSSSSNLPSKITIIKKKTGINRKSSTIPPDLQFIFLNNIQKNWLH